MKKMKWVAVALCAAFVWGGVAPVSAKGDAYRETVAKMLELSNTHTVTETMMDQLLPLLRQALPDAPPEYWERMEEKWNRKVLEGRLVDLYVPIYKKYFTLKDLKRIVAFYKTPIGRKLSASLPAMMTEGMRIGEQLGWEIMMEVWHDLKELGVEL